MHWKIGKARITRVIELETLFPLQGLLPDISHATIDKHRQWLTPLFLNDDNQCKLAIQAFVIEVGDLRVLVDTCLGEHESATSMLDTSGTDFLANLAQANYPRESITHVLCTHMHFDHVGWNTMRDGEKWVPTFPNARYLFARNEYEYWRNADEPGYSSTFADAIMPIIEAGLADLVECDHSLGEAIKLVPTPGHSPGHVSVEVHSQGDKALITGDATHHPIQWAEVDEPMMADYDSAQAAASRRFMIEHFAGSTLVIGTHYPAPVAGHLVPCDMGARFIPGKK